MLAKSVKTICFRTNRLLTHFNPWPICCFLQIGSRPIQNTLESTEEQWHFAGQVDEDIAVALRLHVAGELWYQPTAMGKNISGAPVSPVSAFWGYKKN